MFIQVNGHNTFCYTAGKAFDASRPTLLFVHGVLNDHSVWIMQTRYFAHHGFNVLAVDLPGHGKSQGRCPESVQEAASFVWALLDAVGVGKAVLIGHSWGSLIALHAASMAAKRIQQLVMVGTAYPMKVSPALLEMSLQQPMQAIDLVTRLSHSTLAPPPSALGPGTWLYGSSRALMRRILASNATQNLFHLGFQACDHYDAALAALDKLIASTSSMPRDILFILGAADQMTPPKAAQSLIERCPQATVIEVAGGHAMMTEAPEPTLRALIQFIRNTPP